MDFGLGFREKYQWHEDELRALEERQLTRIGPSGVDAHWLVWPVEDKLGIEYMVKIVANHSNELRAIRKMIALGPPAQTHTIPVQLIECSQTSIIVMPSLWTARIFEWQNPGLHNIFKFFNQILEGLRIMHENNVAFLDIARSNMVYSFTPVEQGLFTVPEGVLYYIDFGSARLLPSGPKNGVYIYDWSDAGGHYDPPEGEDVIDPYAYDIYSLGHTLKELSDEVSDVDPTMQIPSCMCTFFEHLRTPDPSQRPTIWRTIRLFRMLRFWIAATGWLHSIVGHSRAEHWIDIGWRVLLPLVR